MHFKLEKVFLENDGDEPVDRYFYVVITYHEHYRRFLFGLQSLFNVGGENPQFDVSKTEDTFTLNQDEWGVFLKFVERICLVF